MLFERCRDRNGKGKQPGSGTVGELVRMELGLAARSLIAQLIHGTLSFIYFVARTSSWEGSRVSHSHQPQVDGLPRPASMPGRVYFQSAPRD